MRKLTKTDRLLYILKAIVLLLPIVLAYSKHIDSTYVIWIFFIISIFESASFLFEEDKKYPFPFKKVIYYKHLKKLIFLFGSAPFIISFLRGNLYFFLDFTTLLGNLIAIPLMIEAITKTIRELDTHFKYRKSTFDTLKNIITILLYFGMYINLNRWDMGYGGDNKVIFVDKHGIELFVNNIFVIVVLFLIMGLVAIYLAIINSLLDSRDIDNKIFDKLMPYKFHFANSIFCITWGLNGLIPNDLYISTGYSSNGELLYYLYTILSQVFFILVFFRIIFHYNKLGFRASLKIIFPLIFSLLPAFYNLFFLSKRTDFTYYFFDRHILWTILPIILSLGFFVIGVCIFYWRTKIEKKNKTKKTNKKKKKKKKRNKSVRV